MQIDRRVSVVEVGDGQVQVGNGPGAVVLDARPPGVRRVLAELREPSDPPWTVARLARRSGLGADEVSALLDGLGPALVTGAVAPAEGCGDGPAAGLDGSPWPAVHVAGLGVTGIAVADLLVRLGVERLWLTDPRPVSPGLLAAGLIRADLGRPRAEALAQRLAERLGRHGPTVVAGRDDPRRRIGDVTVLVEAGGWDVDRIARAQAAGHPVLPVLLRDEDTVVGPWCAPATPGCPLCWERWAEQEDPLRPERTASLRRAEAGRDPVLRAHRTALAVAEALQAGPVAGTAWQVSAPADGSGDTGTDAGIGVVTVPAWPGCACAAETPLPPQATSVPWRSSMTSWP